MKRKRGQIRREGRRQTGIMEREKMRWEDKRRQGHRENIRKRKDEEAEKRRKKKRQGGT